VSPILDMQTRMRELGRIRMGVQVDVKGKAGKRRPERLDTFRLTSPSLSLIQRAAQEYGGTVEAWTEGGRNEWQVIVETKAIDIVIPPDQSVSQWFELYTAGGCQRRCDGVTNTITSTPCACPKDTEERLDLAAKGEACKVTTRLSVMLPQVPDIGTWLLVTHSYNAALELASVADLLRRASEAGFLIPASLRIDQRERKVPGQPTKHFPVPVIELRETRLADLPLLSEQGGRPGLAPRTAVPALPSTTLPPTSDFRAPLPADEGEAGSDERPDADSGGGAPVQPEAPQSQASGARDAFLEWLRQNGITLEYAEQVKRLVWPSMAPGALLRDEDFPRLRAAIDRARAGERV
jgi:hypothetical protein